MKQFRTVLGFELNSYFKNKSFLITTILLMVVLAGIVIVPAKIPGFLEKMGVVQSSETAENEEDSGEKSEILEDTPETLEELREQNDSTEILGICYADASLKELGSLVLSAVPVDKWIVYTDEEQMESDVQGGYLDAGFYMKDASDVTYVVKDKSMDDWYSDAFSEALTQILRQQYYMEKGLTAAEISEAETLSVNLESRILGTDSAGSYWYTYALVMAVYLLILFYGQMIAVSVTTEKSNRAIEILVTSVSPNSLICGKVLAGAIAGVVQMGLILGSAFAAYFAVQDDWGGALDSLFHIPGNVFAVYLVFAGLSYLLYAFLFGMLGALVSKTEDISKSSTPVMLIYIASFFIAIFGMTDTSSMLVKVASYIPFTAGNAMFIRVAMGTVPLWEILLSAGILAVSCAFIGLLAARLFRFGTLHYGNPIKFGDALKASKEQG